MDEPEAVRYLGFELFDRIAHPNWSVEWNLPRWLGARLRLAERTQRELVRANIFGLGYVRLHDDRRDGELKPESESSAMRLEALLFGTAESAFLELIGQDDDFRSLFYGFLERWHASESQVWAHLPMGVEYRKQLADAGAPLYIVCAAARALHPAELELESLLLPVRHYLTAAVLYDHLKDWSSDLENQRSNIFISIMQGELSIRNHPSARRLQVYEAFIHVEKVETYLQTIYSELTDGALSAQAVGLNDMAQHLSALESEAHSSGERMLRGIDALLHQAKTWLSPEESPLPTNAKGEIR